MTNYNKTAVAFQNNTNYTIRITAPSFSSNLSDNIWTYAFSYQNSPDNGPLLTDFGGSFKLNTSTDGTTAYFEIPAESVGTARQLNITPTPQDPKLIDGFYNCNNGPYLFTDIVSKTDHGCPDQQEQTLKNPSSIDFQIAFIDPTGNVSTSYPFYIRQPSLSDYLDANDSQYIFATDLNPQSLFKIVFSYTNDVFNFTINQCETTQLTNKEQHPTSCRNADESSSPCPSEYNQSFCECPPQLIYSNPSNQLVCCSSPNHAVINNSCVCSDPIMNNVNNVCTCPDPSMTVVNGKCTCSMPNQIQQGYTCVCIDPLMNKINNVCTCPNPNMNVINGTCTCSLSNSCGTSCCSDAQTCIFSGNSAPYCS